MGRLLFERIDPSPAERVFDAPDPEPVVLTKDLLRVSRAGGGYSPQFTDPEDRSLAARVLGIYQGHVGESRAVLEDALADLETEYDFKLVRGLAKLAERDGTFEVRAPVDPERARKAVFAAAEDRAVISEADRERTLETVATTLDTTPAALDRSLYADLDDQAMLTAFDSRFTPEELRAQYDLSLAQTALFDATEIRVRSADPRALVSAVKRLRLMYEIERTSDGRIVSITGPTALLRRTRRYGTRFARLLRTVTKAAEWRLEATIDDRGTDRELVLTDETLSVPGNDPVVEVSYDSAVESDFATRFEALSLDWELLREPTPLAAGTRVMIPDFAFEWPYPSPTGTDRPFRVYFEIMGFWTPEYVTKKLDQLATLEAVDMLVAVDESLGVGADIEARDARAIPYSGTVDLKAVRDALRGYETRLIDEGARSLPAELIPDADVIAIEALAADHRVSERAFADREFPDHERIGRTLVRPWVLNAVADRLEAGQSLADAEGVLAEYDLSDASAVLSALGYRVEWEGLAGGVLREKDRSH
jgi:uncharacterized protein